MQDETVATADGWPTYGEYRQLQVIDKKATYMMNSAWAYARDCYMHAEGKIEMSFKELVKEHLQVQMALLPVTPIPKPVDDDWGYEKDMALRRRMAPGHSVP